MDVWTPTIYACSQREVGQPLSHQNIEAVFLLESWELWDGALSRRKERKPPTGVQALHDNVPVEAIQDIAPADPAQQDMDDPAGSDMEQLPSEHGSDSADSTNSAEDMASAFDLLDEDNGEEDELGMDTMGLGDIGNEGEVADARPAWW